MRQIKINSTTGSEIITTNDVKNFVRIDTSADDALIGTMITAARIAAENFMSRDIVAKTRTYYLPSVRLDLLPKHLLEATEKIAGPIFLSGKAGVIDCEHRSFHFMAINKNNARIMIAPEIIFSNKI